MPIEQPPTTYQVDSHHVASATTDAIFVCGKRIPSDNPPVELRRLAMLFGWEPL